MRGILSTLLAIAVRGGMKLGVIFLTIALFTGIITSVQNIVYAYSDEMPFLMEIAAQPRIAIFKQEKPGAVEVRVVDVCIDGTIATLIAPSSVTEYLDIIGGGSYSPLKTGEMYVSGDIMHYVQEGALEIEGKILTVKDESIPTSLLFKTLIISAETAEEIGLPTVSLYYSRYLEADSISWVEGPSSMSLIRGLTSEVQMFLSTITGLMYVLLCLTSLVQAFYVMSESRDTLRFFSVFGLSNYGMILNVVALAVIVSFVSVGFGYALGVISSASASAIVSIVLKIPYIKPNLSDELVFSLLLAFVSSSLGLSMGYVRGSFSASLG